MSNLTIEGLDCRSALPYANSSAEAAQLSTCYGKGKCLQAIDQGYYCSCERGYLTQTNCAVLSPQFYYPALLIERVVVLIYTFFFAVVIVAELVVDFRVRREISWRKPVTLAKIFLLSHLVVSILGSCVGISESATFVIAHPGFPSFLNAVYTPFLGLVFGLTTVQWLSILLQGRHLQDSFRNFQRLRLGIFVLLCVLIPLYFITSILNAFEIGRPFVGYISTGVIILFCFVLEVSCGYHMIKLLIWTAKQARKSSTMQKILRKSVWLAIANLCLLQVLGANIYSFAVPSYRRHPWNNVFANTVVNDIFFFILYLGLVMFLENYMVRSEGFLKSYILGCQGKLATAGHTLEGRSMQKVDTSGSGDQSSKTNQTASRRFKSEAEVSRIENPSTDTTSDEGEDDEKISKKSSSSSSSSS